jgi:hypothetical protein
MLGSVPYYPSYAFIDYAVPVCYTRARWLDYFPPVYENWLEVDMNDLDSEELYGAFCELHEMKRRGDRYAISGRKRSCLSPGCGREDVRSTNGPS